MNAVKGEFRFQPVHTALENSRHGTELVFRKACHGRDASMCLEESWHGFFNMFLRFKQINIFNPLSERTCFKGRVL